MVTDNPLPKDQDVSSTKDDDSELRLARTRPLAVTLPTTETASALPAPTQTINTAMAIYHGPIPPAQEAARWNQVVEGAAERILRMAEKQSATRQESERKRQEHVMKMQLMEMECKAKELDLNHSLQMKALEFQEKIHTQRNHRTRMGQIFGLCLGVGAMLVAAFLGVKGQPLVAGLLGTGGLAGIIWAGVSGGKRAHTADINTETHKPE